MPRQTWLPRAIEQRTGPLLTYPGTDADLIIQIEPESMPFGLGIPLEDSRSATIGFRGMQETGTQ
jgi:hypothetical protein